MAVQFNPESIVRLLRGAWNNLRDEWFLSSGKEKASAGEVRAFVMTQLDQISGNLNVNRFWRPLADAQKAESLSRHFPRGTTRVAPRNRSDTSLSCSKNSTDESASPQIDRGQELARPRGKSPYSAASHGIEIRFEGGDERGEEAGERHDPCGEEVFLSGRPRSARQHSCEVEL